MLCRTLRVKELYRNSDEVHFQIVAKTKMIQPRGIGIRLYGRTLSLYIESGLFGDGWKVSMQGEEYASLFSLITQSRLPAEK